MKILNSFSPTCFAAMMATLLLPSSPDVWAAPGDVSDWIKIASGTNGGPILKDEDTFGTSSASMGDLDGDGVPELAVGSLGDKDGGGARGEVYILFLNADGTVKNSTKIAHETNGGPTLEAGDRFGGSCASLGDLDGDGVPELAVGAWGDGGNLQGAVHILFLRNDGTVKGSTKIAHETNGGPTLVSGELFGVSSASLGDLDGDGVPELAVGAQGGGDSGRGVLHILFLRDDGTVKSSTKIAHETNGGPTLADFDAFGSSCTSLGDMDADGVPELAVGARFDDTGSADSYGGAVYLLFLEADGTVKRSTKFAHETSNGGPTLADFDAFGSSCVSLGDLDGDGVPELAIGADGDDTGSVDSDRGAVYILFLRNDGKVRSTTKIAHQPNGQPELEVGDSFGSSLAFLGDLDEDGMPELAVGASFDDTGGADSNRGAVHILSLGDAPITVTTELDENGGGSGAGKSLREAIGEAENSREFRKIWFDPSLDGKTITLDGQLDIVDQEVEISAENLPGGITLSGDNQTRIFEVDAHSTLVLDGLVLRDGFVPQGETGGAILNHGLLNVKNSRVTGNTAEGHGGGIMNRLSGTVFLTSVTLDNNKATQGAGGGFYDFGDSIIINSTITGNEAVNPGGGMAHRGEGVTTLRHVTIVGNYSEGAGGGAHLDTSLSAPIRIVNSILAENTSSTLATDLSNNEGTIEASGENLIGSNQSVAEIFSANSPLVGSTEEPVLANLRPLGENGGRTPTMQPMPGSPALDAGGYFPLPGTDQRFAIRSDGMPDLGAVEGVFIPDNRAAKVVLSKKIRALKKKFKKARRKKQVSKVKKLKKQAKKLAKQLRAL